MTRGQDREKEVKEEIGNDQSRWIEVEIGSAEEKTFEKMVR